MMESERSIRRLSNPAFVTALGCVLWLALVIFGGAGCQRLKTGAPNMVASVTITNRSMTEITGAAEAVFTKHEFRGGRTGPAQLTFQQPGSAMDVLVYGDWIDRKVIVRVGVTLQQQGTNSTLVACDARLVSAPGDLVFEETFKVPKSVKTQCQEMLGEIQARLK